jgi:hypothetical protein
MLHSARRRSGGDLGGARSRGRTVRLTTAGAGGGLEEALDAHPLVHHDDRSARRNGSTVGAAATVTPDAQA